MPQLCFPGVISFPRESPVASLVIFMRLFAALEGWKGKQSHPSPAGAWGQHQPERRPWGQPDVTPSSQHQRDHFQPPRAEARNLFSLPFGLRKITEPTQRNPKEMKQHQNPLYCSKAGLAHPHPAPSFPRIKLIFASPVTSTSRDVGLQLPLNAWLALGLGKASPNQHLRKPQRCLQKKKGAGMTGKGCRGTHSSSGCTSLLINT